MNPQTQNQSILHAKAATATRFSKFGILLGALAGYIYSTQFIDICEGTPRFNTCLGEVGIFSYVVMGAVAGFVIGALVGAVIDITRSKK